MRGAERTSSPTRRVRVPSKRACPRNTVQPAIPASHFSMLPRDFAVTAWARAATLAMSTVTGPATTPKSAALRAMCAA